MPTYIGNRKANDNINKEKGAFKEFINVFKECVGVGNGIRIKDFIDEYKDCVEIIKDDEPRQKTVYKRNHIKAAPINEEEKAVNDIVDGFKAFGDAVCNMGNHESTFAHKLQKHRANPRKLAIYLCERYSSQDPDDEFADVFKGEYQPNADLIHRDIPAMEAINIIKDHGWKVKVGEWKDLGPQLIVVKDDGKCFHSNYRW